MALRRRLERLEQVEEKTDDEGPSMMVYLGPGKWFLQVDGYWVSWSKNKPLPRGCKVYTFFPDNPPEGIRRYEPA